MKIKCNIFETMDYDLFSKLQGNREINELHIKRLSDSMNEVYLLKPIDVNDKYEVIDGQHRLEVCKRLKLPVYFIIHEGWGLHEAHRLNGNQKNWTSEMFLNGYCELGCKDYFVFKDFKEKYGFNMTITHSLLLNHNEKPCGQYIKDFQNGKFKVKNLNTAIRNAEKLLMIKPYYQGYDRTVFVWALLAAINNKDFNYQEFLTKLSYQSTKLVDCTSTKQYLVSIEEIYNYKRRGDKIRLF